MFKLICGIVVSCLLLPVHAFQYISTISKRLSPPSLPPRREQQFRFVATTSSTTTRLKIVQAVEIIEEKQNFELASQCFVDAFWAEKANDRKLTSDQKRKLERDQLYEFRRRYGGPTSNYRQSAFFIALHTSDDASDSRKMKQRRNVLGCAGVEVEIPVDPNLKPSPIMSNLAVALPGRRNGLAIKLVKKCEDKCRQWGFASLALVVEKKNKKARALYNKLGYRIISRDPDSSTLLPLPDGRIQKCKVTTLTMRRNLLLPAFPSFLPLLLFFVAAGGGGMSMILSTTTFFPLFAFLS
mmetsp:Transcript_12866/g.19284  ORF Transcript_12866/g.19284 Transcript_12866/m.19284 type:complete len:297 (-) Transcript_12866:166-1056(-)